MIISILVSNCKINDGNNRINSIAGHVEGTGSCNENITIRINEQPNVLIYRSKKFNLNNTQGLVKIHKCDSVMEVYFYVLSKFSNILKSQPYHFDFLHKGLKASFYSCDFMYYNLNFNARVIKIYDNLYDIELGIKENGKNKLFDFGHVKLDSIVFFRRKIF